MKFASASFRNALRSDVSTFCRIITITLDNGTVYRYTDLDRDLKIGLNTYVAAGVDMSAVRQSSIGGGNGGSLTLVMSDTDAEITEERVRSRALAGARYVYEMVDYTHPEYGTMTLGVGRFGSIDFDDRGECRINLNGLLSDGARTLGEVYSQECRNDFGDEICRYPVEDLRVAFVIDQVFDNQTFVANELTKSKDGYWDYGVVTFTSGLNAGTSLEVARSYANGEINLGLGTSYNINPGDAASIVPGCSKTRTQCRQDYNNVLNMRAEPDAPTIDNQNIPIANGTTPSQPANSPVIRTDRPSYVKTFGANG